MLATHNWPLPVKLGGALVLPVVIALLLAGLWVRSSLASSDAYARTGGLLQLADRGTDLVHALAAERDLVTAYAAGRRGPVGTDVTQQQSTVDSMASRFRLAAAGVEDDRRQQVGAVVDRLDGLAGVRRVALSTKLPAVAAMSEYTRVIEDLLDLERSLLALSSETGLGRVGRALAALSTAQELTSRQRAQLAIGLTVGRLDAGGAGALLATRAQLAAANRDFVASASPAQRQLYQDTVTGPASDRVEQIMRTVLLRSGSSSLGIAVDESFRATTTMVELLRRVEQALLDTLLERTGSLRWQERRRALQGGGMLLAVLLLALLISFGVTRSMLRSVRVLRSNALKLAHWRPPEPNRRPAQRRPGLGAPPVLDSGDEIGQIACAFDVLHRRSLRLAAEQAELRSNVSSMFVNLSRRTQGLIERQLTLVHQLRTGEQHPGEAAALAELDRLANRLRRNSENLLALAGEESRRRCPGSVPLIGVLRTAVSEVEHHGRVRLSAVPDAEIAGHAVNHLRHLLAELLENATAYSPPQSTVVVHGRRLSDGGALVEIVDSGLGMTAAQLAEANQRLTTPPPVDVALSRMMGLLVVGRLAARHRMVVRLRRSEPGGVAAFVRIPAPVLVGAHRRVPATTQATPVRCLPPVRSLPPVLPVPAGLPGPGLPAVLPVSAGLPGPVATGRDLGSYGGVGGRPLGYMIRTVGVSPGPGTAVGQADGRGTERAQEDRVGGHEVVAPRSEEWFGDRAPAAGDDATADAGRERGPEPTPSSGGTTPAGLPRRIPRAQLDASAFRGAEPGPSTGDVPERPSRSPDEVRSRLEKYHHGVRRGRQPDDDQA
ncbi:MAG TPA: nitrate- and nitrite sensing domain-containing protein [Mycobacteriales bacterium]|nr:nitrate- and nitrite sensing domain-containing protein [Mycobacteriales bacterium]